MTPEQVEAGGQTIKVGKVRITETPLGSDYSGPFGVIQHSVIRPACLAFIARKSCRKQTKVERHCSSSTRGIWIPKFRKFNYLKVNIG
jgi:hypothetical protein